MLSLSKSDNDELMSLLKYIAANTKELQYVTTKTSFLQVNPHVVYFKAFFSVTLN